MKEGLSLWCCSPLKFLQDSACEVTRMMMVVITMMMLQHFYTALKATWSNKHSTEFLLVYRTGLTLFHLQSLHTRSADSI